MLGGAAVAGSIHVKRMPDFLGATASQRFRYGAPKSGRVGERWVAALAKNRHSTH